MTPGRWHSKFILFVEVTLQMKCAQCLFIFQAQWLCCLLHPVLKPFLYIFKKGGYRYVLHTCLMQKEKFKEDVNELTFLHMLFSNSSFSLSLSPPQNWQILEGSRGQPLMRGPRAQQDLLTTMMRLESRVVTMRYSFVVKGNT